MEAVRRADLTGREESNLDGHPCLPATPDRPRSLSQLRLGVPLTALRDYLHTTRLSLWRGQPSRVAVIKTVSKFMTNEPP